MYGYILYYVYSSGLYVISVCYFLRCVTSVVLCCVGECVKLENTPFIFNIISVYMIVNLYHLSFIQLLIQFSCRKYQ